MANKSREKEAREKATVAKSQAEARHRAERVAVERFTAKSRDRVVTEVRERAAVAAKMDQKKMIMILIPLLTWVPHQTVCHKQGLLLM